MHPFTMNAFACVIFLFLIYKPRLLSNFISFVLSIEENLFHKNSHELCPSIMIVPAINYHSPSLHVE